MILVDPKDTHQLVADEREGISYSLRVPRFVDRVKYRRAVRKEGGKAWNDIQMLDMLAEGVRRILDKPEDEQDREEYLGAISEYRRGFVEFAEEVRDGQHTGDDDPIAFMRMVAEKVTPPPLVRQIDRVVQEYYLPYADMLADNEVYGQIAGAVAARMFMVGWEGLSAEFRATRDGVPDDVLAHIPEGHLLMIGAEMARLLQPGEERLKNSPSPSGGASDQETSPAAKTPPRKVRSARPAASQTDSSSQEPDSPS